MQELQESRETNGDSPRCTRLCCMAVDMAILLPWHSSLHSNLWSVVLMGEIEQIRWVVPHTGFLGRREHCDRPPALLVPAKLPPSPSPGLSLPSDPLSIQPRRESKETCSSLPATALCHKESITKVRAHLHAIKALHTLIYTSTLLLSSRLPLPPS